MKALSFFLLFFSFSVFANQILNPKPLQIVNTESRVHVETGTLSVDLFLELDKKHHAYQDQFQLKVLTPGFEVKSFTVGPEVRFYDPNSKKHKQGIAEGRSHMSAEVKILSPPQGQVNLLFELTYQACTKTYCLLPIKIKKEIPVMFKGSQSFQTSNALDSSQIFKKSLEKGVLFSFLFLFLAGFLTSLTPCILPMIPITLSVLRGHHEKTKMQSFLLSLSYVFGIGITYASLGLIAASSGVLFGSLLGNFYFILISSLIFLIMGLSLLGLFEFPSLSLNRFKAKEDKSYFGVFLTGLTAGLVATPCVGPVLVSVLIYVSQTQELLFGFVSLFVFAMGMGLLFIFLGLFNRLEMKLGHFMKKIQVFMGVCLVAFSFYMVYPLVKPHISFLFTEKKALPFQTYTEDIYKRAVREKRSIVIDFWADWCLACKELELLTFSAPQVQALKTQFLFLKFDATKNSKELKALMKKYHIVGLPHLVFYSHGKYKKHLTLQGFENAEKFSQRLKEVLKK